MFRIILCTVLAGGAILAQTPTSIPNGLPAWAYNIPDKVQPPSAEAKGAVRVPGSTKEYDAAKIGGNANPPDWFPDEHGPAPGAVKGEAGVTMACGSCHLMSGQGHPESADIAGLPAEYIVRQMNYFKSGARKDDNRMGPIAKAISDEDVRKSAEYFAALKPIPFVKVIETGTPPKTYIATAGRHRLLTPGGGTEPIGHRIIQTPEDPVRIGESRSAFRISGLRSARQYCERGDAGKDRRRGKDHSVRDLSWGRVEGAW